MQRKGCLRLNCLYYRYSKSYLDLCGCGWLSVKYLRKRGEIEIETVRVVRLAPSVGLP